MLHKLVFDTTDAGSIEDSHSVGAHVRAGQGGALITYHGDVQANAASDAFVPGDVTAGTDSIALPAHGFNNGDRVQFATDDTLPDPLVAATDYWVIYISSGVIKVAASQSDAELGIAIDLTDGGVGNHTITAQPYNIRALDVHVVNDVVVSATDLDIRDLNAAQDSVASWINDGSGNPISSTAGALDVNIASSDINIEVDLDGVYSGGNTNPDNVGMIAHVRAAAPADTDQTFRSTGGAASSDAVVAANVHGLDVNSFGMLWNGATWDRATGTGGVADVSDSALGNSTLQSNATALTANTATNVTASILIDRKYLWLANLHNRDMFIGGTGVTIAQGFPLPQGSIMELRAGAAVVVEAITATSTSSGKDLRVLQLS